jgi:hypothetical protein
VIAEFYAGPFDGKVEEFPGPVFRMLYIGPSGEWEVEINPVQRDDGRWILPWPKGLM